MTSEEIKQNVAQAHYHAYAASNTGKPPGQAIKIADVAIASKRHALGYKYPETGSTTRTNNSTLLCIAIWLLSIGGLIVYGMHTGALNESNTYIFIITLLIGVVTMASSLKPEPLD